MESFRNYLSKRNPGAHKGDYGHALIIAGSLGFTGAAYLCAQAAIRSGSGLVTLGIPRSLNSILASKLTEVMTKPLPETANGSLDLRGQDDILQFCRKFSVVAIGPGLSLNKSTQSLVRNLARKINAPLVIDADALNAIADDIDVLNHIKKESVITPHPGEFSRLTKLSLSEVQADRKRLARKFAGEYNITVVLKGARTVVASSKSGQLYINKTGNPGMATAGSGDVLTGIITGFMAQGLDAYKAAKMGVYVHGLAGDMAAKEKGEISLIASDILEKLPVAIKKVLS